MIILGIFKDLVEKMDNMQERMWNFSGEMAISFLKLGQESLESQRAQQGEKGPIQQGCDSVPRAVTTYPLPCSCAPYYTCVFVVANCGKRKIKQKKKQNKEKKAKAYKHVLVWRNQWHKKPGSQLNPGFTSFSLGIRYICDSVQSTQ